MFYPLTTRGFFHIDPNLVLIKTKKPTKKIHLSLKTEIETSSTEKFFAIRASTRLIFNPDCEKRQTVDANDKLSRFL